MLSGNKVVSKSLERYNPRPAHVSFGGPLVREADCARALWSASMLKISKTESLICEQLGLAPAEIMGNALRASTTQVSIL
jgi:hypothetical protein